jgi:hypothetical protein
MRKLAVVVVVAKDPFLSPRGVLGRHVEPFVVRDAAGRSSPAGTGRRLRRRRPTEITGAAVLPACLGLVK